MRHLHITHAHLFASLSHLWNNYIPNIMQTLHYVNKSSLFCFRNNIKGKTLGMVFTDTSPPPTPIFSILNLLILLEVELIDKQGQLSWLYKYPTSWSACLFTSLWLITRLFLGLWQRRKSWPSLLVFTNKNFPTKVWKMESLASVIHVSVTLLDNAKLFSQIRELNVHIHWWCAIIFLFYMFLQL